MIDDRELFIAKMMLVASKWFGAKVDIDDIPLLIKDKDATKF